MVPDGASCRTGRSSMFLRCSTRSTSAKRRWGHNAMLSKMIYALSRLRAFVGQSHQGARFNHLHFISFLSCILSLVLRRCLRSSPTSREPPMERWGLKSSSTYRSSAKRLSMQLTGDSFMDSTFAVIWYILWIDQLFDNVEMFWERGLEKQERALTQCQIILQEQGWFPDNGWNQACEQECNKEWDQGKTLSKIQIHFNENLFTGDNPRVWLWQGWKAKHSRVPPGCLFFFF